MPALHDRRLRSYFVHNDDGALREMSATTCAHGNEIIVRKPGQEQGIHWDFCMKCMAPICLRCAMVMARSGECVAFEKALERMEGRTRLPPIERQRATILGRQVDPAEARERWERTDGARALTG